jgi:hypothetical protein
MRTWLQEYRQVVLDELVRRDGLGDDQEPGICPKCGDEGSKATVKCLECSGNVRLCQNCTVSLHRQTPLHRVEVSDKFLGNDERLTYLQKWEDGCFQRTSLAALGLVFQLNHSDGSCPVPISIHDPFVVIDMNGAHVLELKYCGCSKGSHLHRYQQLLREAWYPASYDRPRTAFTFDVLDTYHKLTLQGKLNLYDFYHGVLHKTDNCGRNKKIVSPLSFPADALIILSLFSIDTMNSRDVSANGAT